MGNDDRDIEGRNCCLEHADCDEADAKADEEGVERPPHYWSDDGEAAWLSGQKK